MKKLTKHYILHFVSYFLTQFHKALRNFYVSLNECRECRECGGGEVKKNFFSRSVVFFLNFAEFIFAIESSIANFAEFIFAIDNSAKISSFKVYSCVHSRSIKNFNLKNLFIKSRKNKNKCFKTIFIHIADYIKVPTNTILMYSFNIN